MLSSYSLFFRKEFISTCLQLKSIRSMAIDIGGMRKPYLNAENTFDIKDLVSRNPFDQFKSWFDEATKCEKIEEANAMSVSTATKDGRPSSRMVLCKKISEDGFIFYTNYQSRKASELEKNPYAALMFYWEPLKRSVRIEGMAQKVSQEESENYFHSRPFGSQIGAAVSNQSTVIENRNVLTDKEKELKQEYGEQGEKKTLEKPEHWGGYIVKPEVIEFWQGQSTRIHDRIRFRQKAQGENIDESVTTPGEKNWVIERLAP